MTEQRADYPLDYSRGPAATPRNHPGERLVNIAENAQDMAQQLAGQAREYGEKAQELAQNFKPYVERSLKEQPMTTLAAATAIGFVLGALWKK